MCCATGLAALSSSLGTKQQTVRGGGHEEAAAP